MTIRCQEKPKHPARAQFKFKCRWCKRWVCAACEGTASADPVANGLCDTCWYRRFKKKQADEGPPRRIHA